MRKWILGSLGAIVLVLAGGGWFVYDNFLKRVAPRDAPASLAELVDSWADLGEVPGVIMHIEKNGLPVFSRAAGTLTRGGDLPATVASPFHIASVGKLFTAATVLRLAERGELDLDAPISDHLDHKTTQRLVVIDDEDLSASVTARQLLAHRGGLANTDEDLAFIISILGSPQAERTPHDLLAHARKAGGVARPGEMESYASPGYFLLGLLIEAVSEKPYHQAVRDEIFTPLEMNETFEANHEWIREPTELHHYFGSYDLWTFDPSFEFADGGFVTTATDLAKFGRAFMHGELFTDPDTYNQMIAPPADVDPLEPHFYQGLGPLVWRDQNDVDMLMHMGFWGVALLMAPEEDVVIVSTTSQANSNINAWLQSTLDLTRSELGLLQGAAEPDTSPTR